MGCWPQTDSDILCVFVFSALSQIPPPKSPALVRSFNFVHTVLRRKQSQAVCCGEDHHSAPQRTDVYDPERESEREFRRGGIQETLNVFHHNKTSQFHYDVNIVLHIQSF